MMLIISAITKEYILKFKNASIVIVINLTNIPEMLINVDVFTLFRAIRILDNGDSK